MSNWREEKMWSDRFIPEIKGLLGGYLIGEPAHEEDALRNTDLIVLKLETVRVACRVRRFKYLARYGNQFTIRSSLPSGGKTELTKIIQGWGDYLFYGFSDEPEESIAQWSLISLNVFRLWFARFLARNNGQPPGMPKDNSDGWSKFLAFNLTDMPSGGIVAARGAGHAFLKGAHYEL